MSAWPLHVLRTREEYEATVREAGQLIRLGDRRSEAQTEYSELLATLIKAYDDKHTKPFAKLDPLEFLIEAM